jgi:hypothetical protein
VALSIGVQWNPRLHYDTLPIYLVYSYESKSFDRMVCLVIHDFGRSRVTRTARDRAPSHDGGSMIGFLLKNE